MDKKILSMEAELKDINERRMELEHDLKLCKENRDRIMQDKTRKELKVLSNRTKHLLFKLGKYKYPEGEPVEFEPGRFMDANAYHWLID